MVAQESTFNEQLFEQLVRHQIGLLFYSGGVRNQIWKLLDATETDVREQIATRLRTVVGKPVTPARLARVEALIGALEETRLRGWKDVNEVWFEEMRSLAVYETAFVAKTIEQTVPVVLGLELPAPERLRAIVKSKPFMGATLKEWSQDIQAKDIARIEQQIKIGLTQGETIPAISRRITGTVSLAGADGVTAITRRHAESITRTAVSAIASESRAMFYEENSDILDEEIFTATLDSRTTPICRPLDGNVYKVGKGPKLPLHWGERSLRLPIIDGEVVGERPMRNFTEKQLLREYASREGFDAPASRDGLPHGSKGAFDAFARKRMRELTGIAPAKLSYQEWLSRQPATFQNDILGPTRGKLFRKGGLELSSFVAPDGRTLTLAELAKYDAAAFRRAGLDPKDYSKN